MHSLYILLSLSAAAVFAQNDLASGNRLQKRSRRKCRYRRVSKTEAYASPPAPIYSAPSAPIYSMPKPKLPPVVVAPKLIPVVPVPKPYVPVRPAPAPVRPVPYIPRPPPSQYNGDAAFSDECLSLHNQFRVREGAAPLVWDNSLATLSYTWAKVLVGIKGLQHSKYQKGENLFATFGGDKSCKAAVQAWYDEKKFYAPGQKIGTGDFHQYGHFTQVCCL